MITVTKSYRDLPAAHRQPNHEGHCKYIHGHNWGFDITFACDRLDESGFVIDLGGLKVVREFLTESFDHTLLLNGEDTYLDFLQTSLEGFAKIITVPNCGMEGLARYVFEMTSALLSRHFPEDVMARGLEVVSVKCLEDSKNSATYSIREA